MHDQRQKTDLHPIEPSGRNDVVGLRGLLFEEMRSLNGKVTKEQLEVAKMKCELAQTIINSVKAETLFLQAKVKNVSSFIPALPENTPTKE